MEFFWFIFSLIWTEYGVNTYSVQMRGNMGQKIFTQCKVPANGVNLDDIKVKLKLSTLKFLHPLWTLDLYHYLTSNEGRKVVENGWKSAGITDAVSKGVSGLEPFCSIGSLIRSG